MVPPTTHPPDLLLSVHPRYTDTHLLLPIHNFFYTFFYACTLRQKSTKLTYTHRQIPMRKAHIIKKKHLATHPALHSPKVCHQKGVKGQDSGQQFTGGAPRRRLERADPNADPRPVG